MDSWDKIVKLARECHSKESWELFIDEHEETLSSSNSSKPIAEIYRLLKIDRQSLQYSDRIWASLVRGALACWDMELARNIADYTNKIPSPALAIPSAKAYLEKNPSITRNIANRTLRLINLSQQDTLQLLMIVCSSYAEEGKFIKAVRCLKKTEPLLRSAVLEDKDRAEFLMQMGRMHFFLGRYHDAAPLFEEASHLFHTVKDPEQEVIAVFNSAVCLHNGGGNLQQAAIELVNRCREIAVSHNLMGPLAGCEAFDGLNAYQNGNFSLASKHFRLAIEYLPTSQNSFRRLHILSMLSYTYLATGRFYLAKKFGQQALDLDEVDKSKRFKSRFDALRADLLWEEGQVETAYDLLAKSVEKMSHQGIHTLEELSAYNSFLLNSANLNRNFNTAKITIDEHLLKNASQRMQMQFALGHLTLNRGQWDQANEIFSKIVFESKKHGNRIHESQAKFGKILVRLARLNDSHTIDLDEIESIVSRVGETSLKMRVKILSASFLYRRGLLSGCVKILKSIQKNSRTAFTERFLVDAWIRTLEGRSARLTSGWQSSLLARATTVYFRPSISTVSLNKFIVSQHYKVDLTRHPSLGQLVNFLLLKSNFKSSLDEIQIQVWNQSLQQQGWQQKIRNSVRRLREIFAPTLAPLLLHEDQTLRLFEEAIFIDPPRRSDDTSAEVLRLLSDGAMSSSQLSHRLRISTSTTKRILQKLSNNDVVDIIKNGRNVYYVAKQIQGDHKRC